MRLRSVGGLLLGGLLVLVPAFAQEQEKGTSKQSVEKRLRDVQKDKSSLTVEKALDALAAASSFGQVAVSPDGKKVAWVEKLHDKSGSATGNSAILATTTDGKAAPRKITASAAAPRAESDIAWAPDSRRVAFLSDSEKPASYSYTWKGLRASRQSA